VPKWVRLGARIADAQVQDWYVQAGRADAEALADAGHPIENTLIQ